MNVPTELKDVKYTQNRNQAQKSTTKNENFRRVVDDDGVDSHIVENERNQAEKYSNLMQLKKAQNHRVFSQKTVNTKLNLNYSPELQQKKKSLSKRKNKFNIPTNLIVTDANEDIIDNIDLNPSNSSATDLVDIVTTPTSNTHASNNNNKPSLSSSNGRLSPINFGSSPQLPETLIRKSPSKSSLLLFNQGPQPPPLSQPLLDTIPIVKKRHDSKSSSIRDNSSMIFGNYDMSQPPIDVKSFETMRCCCLGIFIKKIW
jgi:hypothetical protein